MGVLGWIIVVAVGIFVLTIICFFNIVSSIFAIISGIASFVLAIVYKNNSTEIMKLITLGLTGLTIVFSFGDSALEMFTGETESWYEIRGNSIRERGGMAYEIPGLFIAIGIAAVVSFIIWVTWMWLVYVIAVIAVLLNVYRIYLAITN